MTGAGSLSMSLRKEARQRSIWRSAASLIRTLSFFQATARTESRLMSALLVSVTVIWLDPFGESLDPSRGFGDLILVHRQGDAQMPAPALAKTLARHGDD